MNHLFTCFTSYLKLSFCFFLLGFVLVLIYVGGGFYDLTFLHLHFSAKGSPKSPGSEVRLKGAGHMFHFRLDT